jgi:hypothetical protein
MKNTANLSFLLCICSVVMPAIFLKSTATRLSIQRQEDIAFATQQEMHRAMKSNITEHLIAIQEDSRRLQTDDEVEFDCETKLEILLGFSSDLDWGCACGDDGNLTDECEDFQSECSLCDTIQGEQVCYKFAEAESTARSSSDVEAKCYTYESGPFVGTTNCAIDDYADFTCTIMIDGEKCNSCAIVDCRATDGSGVYGENYDFDCSNIIEGETWNLCTDDIPENSRFLASGNNDRFNYVHCETPTVRREDSRLVITINNPAVLTEVPDTVPSPVPTKIPSTTLTATPSAAPRTLPSASPRVTPSVPSSTAPSHTASLRPTTPPRASPSAQPVGTSTSTGVSHSETRPEGKYVKVRGSSTVVAASRDEDPPSEANVPEAPRDQSIVSNEASTIVRKNDPPLVADIRQVPRNVPEAPRDQSTVSNEASTIVRKNDPPLVADMRGNT